METVNWGLAIGVFVLIGISLVLSLVVIELCDKRDKLMQEKFLLSEENKSLVKENERLSNHIFILNEVEKTTEKKTNTAKVKIQNSSHKKRDCSSY